MLVVFVLAMQAIMTIIFLTLNGPPSLLYRAGPTLDHLRRLHLTLAGSFYRLLPLPAVEVYVETTPPPSYDLSYTIIILGGCAAHLLTLLTLAFTRRRSRTVSKVVAWSVTLTILALYACCVVSFHYGSLDTYPGFPHNWFSRIRGEWDRSFISDAVDSFLWLTVGHSFVDVAPTLLACVKRLLVGSYVFILRKLATVLSTILASFLDLAHQRLKSAVSITQCLLLDSYVSLRKLVAAIPTTLESSLDLAQQGFKSAVSLAQGGVMTSRLSRSFHLFQLVSIRSFWIPRRQIIFAMASSLASIAVIVLTPLDLGRTSCFATFLVLWTAGTLMGIGFGFACGSSLHRISTGLTPASASPTATGVFAPIPLDAPAGADPFSAAITVAHGPAVEWKISSPKRVTYS
ncbi:hypothetical protein C8R43DRAFT_1119894 [Mycena crocata]|nr:hypothetical protein C8R43DRAFT_1119894 [Mycena crocata]